MTMSDIFQALQHFFIGVVSFVVSVVPLGTHVIPTSTPTSVPTIAIEITPTITKSTPTMFINPTASPTATPTISQQIIDKCNGLTKPIDYFSGLDCYQDEYTKAVEDNKGNNSIMSSPLSNMQVKQKSQEGIDQLLRDVCYSVGPTSFENCTYSLNRNVGRFQEQIKRIYEPQMQGCLSKVAAGDKEMRGKIRDYYQRKVMKDNIMKLYRYCQLHSDSFDEYSF